MWNWYIGTQNFIISIAAIYQHPGTIATKCWLELIATLFNIRFPKNLGFSAKQTATADGYVGTIDKHLLYVVFLRLYWVRLYDMTEVKPAWIWCSLSKNLHFFGNECWITWLYVKVNILWLSYIAAMEMMKFWVLIYQFYIPIHAGNAFLVSNYWIYWTLTCISTQYMLHICGYKP